MSTIVKLNDASTGVDKKPQTFELNAQSIHLLLREGFDGSLQVSCLQWVRSKMFVKGKINQASLMVYSFLFFLRPGPGKC